MHFGKTWIGRIATVSADGDIAIDAAKLLRYLILFDCVIIQSIRLREFGVLARMLGVRGLSALLRSGAVRVHCHALTMGQTGQSDISGRKVGLIRFGGHLPKGEYDVDHDGHEGQADAAELHG